MIICDKHKYVFISVPKTGTHTMYKVLTDSFSGVQAEGPYHQKNVPAKCESYFTFATCRHPFTRMVSIWHALTQRDAYKDIYLPKIGGESFLRFCEWYSDVTPENRIKGKGGILLLSQSEWLEGARIDKFLRIENVNEEFSRLDFVGKDMQLPKVLSREYSVWNEIACDRSKELLSLRLKKDFELLGYSPENIPHK